MLRDEVKLGVVHCSATRPGQRVTAADIRQWHRDRGWRDIGYHLVITRDGILTPGRAISLATEKPGELWATQGAHVAGWNHGSIAICLIGGLDARGRAIDAGDDPRRLFTVAQIGSLKRSMAFYGAMFPNIRWLGHRDLSPDSNADGKVTADEWLKTCPGFDVQLWMASWT